jgi:hypothetical protein
MQTQVRLEGRGAVDGNSTEQRDVDRSLVNAETRESSHCRGADYAYFCMGNRTITRRNRTWVVVLLFLVHLVRPTSSN